MLRSCGFQSSVGDGNAFRHVDIDVTERRESRHWRPPLADRGFAEVEVEISEGAGGDGPPAQPQPPGSGDMTKQSSPSQVPSACWK
jgi:hypothetical protein